MLHGDALDKITDGLSVCGSPSRMFCSIFACIYLVFRSYSARMLGCSEITLGGSTAANPTLPTRDKKMNEIKGGIPKVSTTASSFCDATRIFVRRERVRPQPTLLPALLMAQYRARSVWRSALHPARGARSASCRMSFTPTESGWTGNRGSGRRCSCNAPSNSPKLISLSRRSLISRRLISPRL
jgi:hypothetical protein